MPPKSGSKAYRDQQRDRLARLGVEGHQLIEQLVTDLLRCRYRPREAWRLACELTQDEAAAQFNQIRGDPDIRMRGSRICEYEKWPAGGVRPSVRTLKILAAVYGTTWDRLVDIDDLEKMPAHERQAFLDISDLRHGDPLNLPEQRQNRRYPPPPRSGKETRLNRPTATEKPAIAHDQLTTPTPAKCPSEQSAGGLPSEVIHFAGRDGPMTQLTARLAAQHIRGTVVAIYAIDGKAGIGTTAFARHAAHQLTPRYPDGVIWVDLHGHTPGRQPREPTDALEQMLRQLDAPPEEISADLVSRQDLWRRHIHTRRMLIVLDNARTSDQVLPLLPEAPGCLVLVTSGHKLTGLTDAYPLALDVLGWEEAERLFTTLAGEQRGNDRDAVRQILTACDRLPLAIRLITGRLRHHRNQPLADIAKDFADQTAALDAFVAKDPSVQAAFEWSYRLLTDKQRQALRRLSWYSGVEITAVVINAMVAVSPAHGKQLLRELADYHLLDPLPATDVPGGPRYQMHDLLRFYARHHADAEEPLLEREAAMDRLTSTYLTITKAADQLLRPHHPSRLVNNTMPDTELLLLDASQARTWLIAERPNLLACAQATNPTTEAADLSTALALHLCDLGLWTDARYLSNHALTIYRRLTNRHGEIDALCGLGEVERLTGQCHQARAHHTQALNSARHLGYSHGELKALWGLGQIERLADQYEQARHYHTEALTLAKQLGDQLAEAKALSGLGQINELFGELDQARHYHTQALTLARQNDDQRTEADALSALAHIEQRANHYEQAREYHTQALTIYHHLHLSPGEISALRALEEVERLIDECAAQ